MSQNLANYKINLCNAIKFFWTNREESLTKQVSSGNQNVGSRGAVTSGKNMDGFLEFAKELIKANGLQNADIYTKKPLLALPGFYRSTKQWDMIVLNQGELVAALEFKSQVGPSFGNNFNNRAEEAIGTATDFWTAYNKGSLGQRSRKPFLGWIMLLEDCEGSNKPISDKDPHFMVDAEFKDLSYAMRYDLLCQRLIQEGLYSSAALILTSNADSKEGHYHNLSNQTSVDSFGVQFADHITKMAQVE